MKESDILHNLEEFAEKCNISISTVNLKKDSFCTKSGLCKVNGEYRVILDKQLHLSEKIDVLIDAFQQLEVATESLPLAIQRLIKKPGGVSMQDE